MNAREWDLLVQHWLLYTFVLFVFLMCLSTFLSYNASPCMLPSNDFYLVTSLLFFSTLLIKIVFMTHQKTFKFTSICNLVVYLYGLTTHVLLFTKPDVFLLTLHGECLPTVEIIQWSLTCPLLYLSLFSSANKKTDWAARVVMLEHVSIVASGISTLAPPKYATLVVIMSTALSYSAKYTMLRMFYPAQKVLDKQLLPFLIVIVVLYVVFPVIYAVRMAGKISSLTELTLFAFNDVFIKIVYAMVLEFTDYRVQTLVVLDLLEAKKKDTIEKLFLRFIFHEIRNPLSVLASAVDELSEKSGEQEFIRSFQDGINGFSRLLNDLKLMVELHDGRVQLEEMPMNLVELISNSIIKTQPAYEQSVEVVCDETLPMLMGDHYRLTQLTMSIMFYCLQQRDDDYPVKVRIKVLHIFNNIYCIALEFNYMAREFSDITNQRPELVMLRPETYPCEYALEYTFNRRLAEHICALYNGTLDTVNNNNGPQTTLTVTLHMSRHDSLDENCESVEGIKLLVVDDNALQVRALQGLCKSHVGLVAFAYDGKQAVKLAREQSFDLCFMDIVMPVMGGIDAVQKIRNFDKQIVIYGISGNSFKSDYQQMIAAGARQVFTKPLDKKEVLKILENMNAEKEKNQLKDD